MELQRIQSSNQPSKSPGRKLDRNRQKNTNKKPGLVHEEVQELTKECEERKLDLRRRQATFGMGGKLWSSKMDRVFQANCWSLRQTMQGKMGKHFKPRD
jgi:hypothetical protein